VIDSCNTEEGLADEVLEDIFQLLHKAKSSEGAAIEATMELRMKMDLQNKVMGMEAISSQYSLGSRKM
jgi:hypothetical protein